MYYTCGAGIYSPAKAGLDCCFPLVCGRWFSPESTAESPRDFPDRKSEHHLSTVSCDSVVLPMPVTLSCRSSDTRPKTSPLRITVLKEIVEFRWKLSRHRDRVFYTDGITVRDIVHFSQVVWYLYSAQLKVTKNVGEPYSRTMNITSLCLKYQYCLDPCTLWNTVDRLASTLSSGSDTWSIQAKCVVMYPSWDCTCQQPVHASRGDRKSIDCPYGNVNLCSTDATLQIYSAIWASNDRETRQTFHWETG